MARILLVTLILFLSCHTLLSENNSGFEAEKRLFARIHRRLRAAANLPALKWSPELGNASFNIAYDQAQGIYSKDKPQEGNIEGKFWLSRYYQCNERNTFKIIEAAVESFRHAQGPLHQLYWPRTTYFGCSDHGGWASTCGLGSYTEYIVCLYQPPIPGII